jgi:hypothetical protein
MIPYTLSTLCLVVVGVIGHSVELTIPDIPAIDTQVLSGSFQGYSIEAASFVDIAGNLK